MWDSTFLTSIRWEPCENKFLRRLIHCLLVLEIDDPNLNAWSLRSYLFNLRQQHYLDDHMLIDLMKPRISNHLNNSNYQF